MPPLIRRARPEDAARLAEVYVNAGRASWVGHLLEGTLAAFSSTEAEWLEGMEDPEVSILVAELDGEIAALVTLVPSDESVDLVPREIAKLGRLYTDPPAWGKGLGGTLLEAFAEELEARAYEEAILWTAEWNPARALYEAHGWHPDGATREQSLAGETWTEVRYRIAVSQGRA